MKEKGRTNLNREPSYTTPFFASMHRLSHK